MHAGRIDQLDDLFHQARMDIVGLHETRWQSSTVQAIRSKHYTFLLAPANRTGQQGVGVAIRHKLYPALLALHSYSYRVLRFRLRGRGRNLSIIVGYAPTNSETELECNRVEYYKQMQQAVHDAYKHGGSQDVHITLTDANAETGSDTTVAPGILGPHGAASQHPHPETTPNGKRFLQFCIDNNFCIGYSWFYKKHDKLKNTFYPANAEHTPKVIDHILIDGRSKSCLEDVSVKQNLKISTTSIPRPDGPIGHRLVIAKIRFKLSRRCQKQTQTLPYHRPHLTAETVMEKMNGMLNNTPEFQLPKLCGDAIKTVCPVADNSAGLLMQYGKRLG